MCRKGQLNEGSQEYVFRLHRYEYEYSSVACNQHYSNLGFACTFAESIVAKIF